MAADLALTVLLDLLLIPRYEAIGAAIASAIAYTTSTLALLWFFLRLGRAERAGWEEAALPSVDAG